MRRADRPSRSMPGYTCIWEFHVLPEHQAEFERSYGPDGEWVALFRQARGYRETLLLQDRSNSLRYLTIDRWDSIEAYQVFRKRSSLQYEALDRQCARLTSNEIALGEYHG